MRLIVGSIYWDRDPPQSMSVGFQQADSAESGMTMGTTGPLVVKYTAGSKKAWM
jgi:hypothetical protein